MRLSVMSPKCCVLFKSDNVLLTVQCFFIVGLHGGQTKLCFTAMPRLSSRKSDKMLYLLFSLNIWCSTVFFCFFLNLVYIMFSQLEGTEDEVHISEFTTHLCSTVRFGTVRCICTSVFAYWLSMSNRAPSRGWCYTRCCKKFIVIYIDLLFYLWVRQDSEECMRGRWGVMWGWVKPRWERADKRRKMTVAAERYRIPGWAVMLGVNALNLIISQLW